MRRRFLFSLVVLAAAAVALALPGSGAAVSFGDNSIEIVDTGSGHVSMVLDEDGNPVISYSGGTNAGLKVLHCGDADCAAGNSITSYDTTVTVMDTSLALDTTGTPDVTVISYYDATNGDLKILRCTDLDCSSGTITAPDDTANDVGRYNSLALDMSGFAVVSYWDSTTHDLKVLHCGNDTCTDKSIQFPDETEIEGVPAEVGRLTSLVLDMAGHPVISYQAFPFGDEQLRIMHCTDKDCDPMMPPGKDGPEHIELLDVRPDTARMSLTLDEAGFPVVVFHGGSATSVEKSALVVVHCTDVNCAGERSVVLPDVSGVHIGQYAVVVLPPPPPSGSPDDAESLNPVVAYRCDFLCPLEPHGRLRILHCGDPNCAVPAGNTITQPDLRPQVDTNIALALDDKGFPVVAYYDLLNREVRVLHCGDKACSSDPALDTDGDGCTDIQENSTSAPLGGLRDHKNPWDFYDVNGDQVIDLPNDVLGVINHYSPFGSPPYDILFDRGPRVGTALYNHTKPDGVIDLPNDIVGVIAQFGHSCA